MYVVDILNRMLIESRLKDDMDSIFKIEEMKAYLNSENIQSIWFYLNCIILYGRKNNYSSEEICLASIYSLHYLVINGLYNELDVTEVLLLAYGLVKKESDFKIILFTKEFLNAILEIENFNIYASILDLNTFCSMFQNSFNISINDVTDVSLEKKKNMFLENLRLVRGKNNE